MRLPPRLGGVLLPAVGRYSCARLSLGRPPALRATAGAQQLIWADRCPAVGAGQGRLNQGE